MIYFECDHMYDILCTNSTLLPIDFDYEKVGPKDTIKIKPDLVGTLIAKSEYSKDMEIYKRRLEKKLHEDEDFVVANSSLGFLDTSVAAPSESSPADGAKPDDSSEDEMNTSTALIAASTVSEPIQTQRPTQKASVEDQYSKLDAILAKMNDNQKMKRDLLKTTVSIYKELKALRKLLTKGAEEKAEKPCTTPVFYRDTNLSVMGHNNMAPSIYGELIGRHLFSDEELSTFMLFPVRESARKTLSPTRSNVFKDAVLARFGDNDSLKCAVAAVNQLGNDLKRGRRKRKVID